MVEVTLIGIVLKEKSLQKFFTNSSKINSKMGAYVAIYVENILTKEHKFRLDNCCYALKN